MGSNIVKNTLISTVVAGMLVGCGGGGSSSSSSITGAGGGAQKGPFKEGQIVTAQKLKLDGTADTTVSSITTQTDSLGKFNFQSLSWSGATEFKVEGEYLDESTGQYVPGGLLTAVTNVVEGTAPKVNINILTHIASENIKTQMANNIPIAEAKEKAKEVVSKVFKIDLSNTELESLDLTNENKDSATKEESIANTKLLKLSAALSETTNPEETLKKLASDLSDDNGDGKVDGEAEAIFEELKEKESLVKLEEVAQKMEAVIDVKTIPSNDDNLAGTMSINNSISFNDIYEAIQGESISQTITVGGIITSETVTTAEISVSNNATYLVNGLTPTSTTISNGDELTIETTASNDYDGEEEIIVTIGGVDFDFKVQTMSEPEANDTKIKPIFLDFKKDITPSSSVVSQVAQVEGITSTTSVSIDVGTLEISSDGTNWNPSTGTVSLGDYIRITHDASSNYSDLTTSTLTFGEGDNVVKVVFKSFTKIEDETPNDVIFTDVVDAPIFDEENSTTEYITSEAITISGLDDKVDLEVINGEYSFDNISWSSTDLENQVKNGDMIYLRHKSPSTNSTKTTTRLIVGKKLFEFNSFTIASAQEVDSTPNDFVFTSKFNQETNTLVESNTITVSGVSEDTQIEISVSEDSEYSVNGTWSSQSGTVKKGDIVSVRHTTSEDNLDKTETTLTIGGVSSKFVTFNKAADDVIPNTFSFERLESQNTNTEVTSSKQFITGINTETSISIDNGMFSINGGEFVSSAKVNDGDSIVVRQITSTLVETETKSIIKDENNNAFAYFVTKTKKAAPIFDEENSTAPKISVNNGDTYDFTPTVTGATEFEIENKPSWAVFNSRTGQLSGTPNSKELEKTYENIIITAKNEGGKVSLPSFNITVENIAPIIDIVDNYTINTNIFASNILMEFPVKDILGETYTYEFIAGTTDVPSFIEINSTTGEVSTTGTPIEGTYNFKIKVTDSSSESSEKTIELVVSAESPTPTPPSISGTPNTEINEDETYSFTPTASDINGDELTFSIENLPSWANFDPKTGSLAGIPSNNDVGTYSNIIITVDDGTHTTSLDSFNIEVKNTNDAPTTANATYSLNITNNNSYSGTLTASDIDSNETHTFMKVSDPSNGTVTVNSNGSFEYTPNANYIGVDSFTYKANDGDDDSNTSTITINVTDGSTPLNSDVDAAMKIIESIDPEIENIDSKLDEAYALVESNTSTEAQIVKLSIELAKILNDSDISSLLVFENNDSTVDLTDTYTLNKIVRAMTKDLIDLDIMDNPIDLSLTMTNKLNAMADKLSLISDEFGTLFTSSDAVYSYSSETMDTNDSKALRAGILSFAAQLKQLSSYQWMADTDVAIQTEDIGGVQTEYSNIDIDPASVLNSGSVYKLTSAASTRLPEAKENLVAAANLLLDLPLGYGADENDSTDTGLTQEDKNDISSIRDAISGISSYVMSIENDDEIKEVKVALSKLFDSTTAMDITSLGSNWQNLCSNGEIISIEEAKINGALECKVLDWYDSFNDITHFHYEGSEPEPQTMPTAETSKLDDIVLSITKLDDTILTGQDMINFVIDGEDKVEAFGMTLANVKDDEKYLVNGNDVKADDYFDDLFINAYKSEGIDSRAEAKKNFTTPKSEVKAEISLSDVDILSTDATGPIGRGAMIAFMDNINSAGEKLFVKLDLRDGDTTGKIKYYVAKYDSEWASEVELASGTITSTQTVYEYGESKFAVSIATEGSDIKFNVSKVDDSGNTIESYTEAVVTTDASYDLRIDSVRFRAEVRLSGDDGTLYDQVTTPTKFRVHDFEAVTPAELATLSTGDIAILAGSDDWYDIMSVDTDSITLDMYDKNSSGTFAYNESETIKTEFLTGSTLNILDDADSIEEFIEIKNTIAVSGYTDLFKSDLVFTIKKETVDTNTWDWTDHGATSVQELETVFTNGYTYFGGDDTFMLKPSGVVVKGVLTGSDEYGDHYTYGDIINSASWETIGNQIVIDLSTDYKVKFAFELNQYNKIVETETLLDGYQGSDYIYTGSDALQFFQDETGINPSN